MSHVIFSPLITERGENLGMFPIGSFSKMRHTQEAFERYILNARKDGYIMRDENIKEFNEDEKSPDNLH